MSELSWLSFGIASEYGRPPKMVVFFWPPFPPTTRVPKDANSHSHCFVVQECLCSPSLAHFRMVLGTDPHLWFLSRCYLVVWAVCLPVSKAAFQFVCHPTRSHDQVGTTSTHVAESKQKYVIGTHCARIRLVESLAVLRKLKEPFCMVCGQQLYACETVVGKSEAMLLHSNKHI